MGTTIPFSAIVFPSGGSGSWHPSPQPATSSGSQQPKTRAQARSMHLGVQERAARAPWNLAANNANTAAIVAGRRHCPSLVRLLGRKGVQEDAARALENLTWQ